MVPGTREDPVMLAPDDQKPLKRTRLYDLHLSLGARMVPFAGYDMPVQYAPGVLKEHLNTRQKAGLFDVSHMGQIALRAKSGAVADAALALEQLVPQDILAVPKGRQRYAQFTNPTGGISDDFMVANFGDHLFVVVNAACKQADEAHLRAHLSDSCIIEPLADRALIALQGPKAESALTKLGADVSAMKFMDSGPRQVAGFACFVSRSGYTGEDGFEIYIPSDEATSERVWNEVLEAGKEFGILSCGLGARNTLRLESKMALYGHEISDTINVIEAGLDRYAKFEKPEFIGKEALEKVRAEGITRTLVGLEMIERGIARDGYKVFDGSGREEIGYVTSGSPAPFLKKNIALAYVPPQFSAVETVLSVEVRSNKVKAKVVPTPFYKRPKTKS
jgi:aminomethyltransferase